uniref:Uncharacterized protein n=1 Tax=Photinus pyralis TaxID=7054 RepID=A0A1Y1L827_PHOPY
MINEGRMPVQTARVYNMTRPMMQNPRRPAMEACICCGMAPPVSSAVCDVVVLGDVVGKVVVIKGVVALTDRERPNVVPLCRTAGMLVDLANGFSVGMEALEESVGSPDEVAMATDAAPSAPRR